MATKYATHKRTVRGKELTLQRKQRHALKRVPAATFGDSPDAREQLDRLARELHATVLN